MILFYLFVAAYAILTHAKDPFVTNERYTTTTWGANMIQLWADDKKFWEPSLENVCENSDAKIINILGINAISSVNGKPGMDLSVHCQKIFPGYQKPVSGTTLLDCPDIGTQILKCQAMGKKILLTIANKLSKPMKTDAEGIALANTIWELFLGGNGPERPFGQNVILDGVDLVIQDGINGYAVFLKHLKALSLSYVKKQFYISGSPRCSFPDGAFGPIFSNTALAVTPESFDYLSLYAMYSPDCTYRNTDIFYQTIKKWSDWSSSLANPLPLFIALPTSEYLASPGDYVNVTQLIQEKLVENLSTKIALFKGIHLWDSSTDFVSKPCSSNPNNYGSIISGLLSGKNTTEQQQQFLEKCKPAKQSPIGIATLTKSTGPTTNNGNAFCSNCPSFDASSPSSIAPNYIVALLSSILVALVAILF